MKSGKGVSSNLDARLLVHEGMILVEDLYLDKRDPADFAAAVSKYKQALALDPEYALALYALGNAYEIHYNNPPPEGRDPRDVEIMCEYYSQAYAKNWESPETNIGLGWAAFNQGDFPKAFEFFEKTARLKPELLVIDLSVGAFLRSIGLYRQAIPLSVACGQARASKPGADPSDRQVLLGPGKIRRSGRPIRPGRRPGPQRHPNEASPHQPSDPGPPTGGSGKADRGHAPHKPGLQVSFVHRSPARRGPWGQGESPSPQGRNRVPGHAGHLFLSLPRHEPTKPSPTSRPASPEGLR